MDTSTEKALTRARESKAAYIEKRVAVDRDDTSAGGSSNAGKSTSLKLSEKYFAVDRVLSDEAQ
ncbi:hypothetical protein [Tunturiibacter psychrotolerans]|uniref:hypothetical protein n=1 Tax=Tunturiibacter psychrotolerans TaxID=3069686 RepID=UPI003D1B22B0